MPFIKLTFLNFWLSVQLLTAGAVYPGYWWPVCLLLNPTEPSVPWWVCVLREMAVCESVGNIYIAFYCQIFFLKHCKLHLKDQQELLVLIIAISIIIHDPRMQGLESSQPILHCNVWPNCCGVVHGQLLCCLALEAIIMMPVIAVKFYLRKP